jgi:hypothetical protein
LIHKDAAEIEKLLFDKKVIPEFEEFKKSIRDIYQECKSNSGG